MVAERGRQILARGLPAQASPDLRAVCERLIAQRGEASGLALATEIVAGLRRMTPAATSGFLMMLSRNFGTDVNTLDEAVERWRRTRDQDSAGALAAAAESPRQELFRRINMVPGGTAALVGLRGRLLHDLSEHPDLKAVDADFRHLLTSWFNRGFLRLEQIGWDTPAAILERLIQYEAVHEIHGWEDLRLRLAADRRCFAFFHPSLPDEPLIFVEVALCRGIPGSIRPLLDPGREVGRAEDADTAVFYSISNCQKGLRGISFGNFLVKQVTTELAAQLPRLKTFVTLSPVPGLAAAIRRSGDESGFTDERLARLTSDLRLDLGGRDLRAALIDALELPGAPSRALGRVAARLTLAYLLQIRRAGRVADPVAHFHLSNGARLERIHPGGDPADHTSLGVMVNYLYDRDRLEVNHEQYIETGRLIMSSELGNDGRRLSAAWNGEQVRAAKP